MTGCSVLVVDDDPTVRVVAVACLRLEGYLVEVAGDGGEALELLERFPARVVLLDLRMPVLDGWEFAQAIRARGRALALVVMTAATDAQAWAQQMGAEGWVAKPFGTEDLLAEVRRCCLAEGKAAATPPIREASLGPHPAAPRRFRWPTLRFGPAPEQRHR